MPDESSETKEILQRLVRVETKIDLMVSARDMAQEALQSTKAAHRRLDEHLGQMTGIKQSMKWMVGSIISIAGLFIAAVGLLLKVLSQ